MDGRYRSSLRRGLKVAIVLKEDQPTGRRTLGEIENLLSPSDFHPRGIKVRLKDGRVGRVQEILDGAPDKRPAAPANLVVLVIESPEGAVYARELALPTGERVVTLGLDALLAAAPSGRQGETAAEAAARLGVCVQGLVRRPEEILTCDMVLEGRKVVLHGYLCTGNAVRDRQSGLWSWTGWLSPDELKDRAATDMLSDESVRMFHVLQQAR